MITNMKFSTINTKISAMNAKLLSENDFINIMGAKSVQEVFDYLNDHTVYNEVLWDLKGKKLHRGDIERRLYQFRFNTVEKIIHYLDGEYREFIKAYMLRYEIEALKIVFEVVNRNKVLANDDLQVIKSIKYSDIDFDDLLQYKSSKEVLNQLKGTKYYSILLPYIDSTGIKFSFYLEIVLDKYYYHQLIVSAEKVENGKLLKYLKKHIDMYNLEWIYRAVKYFDMSKEEILNFVLDYGYKYDYDKLRDIIYSWDVKRDYNYFNGSDYEFMFNHKYDIDLYMKRRINRYMYYKMLNIYTTSLLSFDKVVAFIYLLEFQLRDIVSIVESKRYSMEAEEISKYLIRTIEVVK